MTDSNSMMETINDGKGNVTIQINKACVGSNGFNYSMNDRDNAFYSHDGDPKNTFAVCIAHEAIHAKHLEVLRQGLAHCNDNREEARNYLLSQGYSPELVDIFFEYKNGEWKISAPDRYTTKEHEYFKKYNHGVFDKVKDQYNQSASW